MDAPVPLKAADRFDGVYTGSMDLFVSETDGAETPDVPTRKVDLQVGLRLSGNFTDVPKGTGTGLERQQIIDGTTVVDDEGGPYKFTKVTYFLDRDVLDMRYSRSSTLTLNQSIPSNFRLTGMWYPKQGGLIKGRVISGVRGYIGDFLVVRQPLISDVETHPKYVGTWIGSPLDVLLSEGVYTTTNPPDFEFDFTPGRIGSMIFESVPFSFNNFAFDYLRGRAIFTDLWNQRSSNSDVRHRIRFRSGHP